ncbi:GAF domain-containing sensor histidine kinase [Phyllobacterium sp. YR531]|uniref:GAF domain-containing sensor histidine kinase n=1 Tax=Phyllobacterium sp. YR531 TaxID=1144343 RepID=UPI00026F75F7|nr:GAF domain-containing sensor histidine kinase [Phyllobacterium sp. YR531]EJM98879.1 histidine kinase with GAF domain containing protein [Phyllobacterium sp. YR531]
MNETKILDVVPNPEFQADIDAVNRIGAVPSILDVVCRTTGMGFAAVARVTEDRWVVCQVLDSINFGIKPGGELEVRTTLCDEIRDSRVPIVIDEVAIDPLYQGHHTPAKYGFQSYLSMPIILPGGKFFGTLCAIDPRPMKLKNPGTIGMFKLFAELIAFHLDANERLASTQAELVDERKIAEFREQFIAVLGHDLRNPVASIDAGTRLLQRTPLNEQAEKIVSLIRGSVVRMSGLIDNVLDLARARLGSGLTLASNADQPLKPVLVQVIDELVSVGLGQSIEANLDFEDPVKCDRERVGQLLSNLLGNAITHGAPKGTIYVNAGIANSAFELSVTNSGDPILPETLDQLFMPFFRGQSRPSQQGLGLGLYIASEIARAHGGTLVAASTAEKTRFTFRMPLKS